jgi:hypothetical protein
VAEAEQDKQVVLNKATEQLVMEEMVFLVLYLDLQ